MNAADPAVAAAAALSTAPVVRRMHQVLLWPLRLLPAAGAELAPRRPWERLGPPWRMQEDEYTGASDQFHERHYQEFVTFKPYVQRFLYGEGRSAGGYDSCMKVLRRSDVKRLRVQTHENAAPRELEVIHVDLYFFDDVDLAILNIELAADELPFDEALQLLYRFGRAYPGGWDAEGNPLHVLRHAEWLDAEGRVLVASDGADREVFIQHVHRHRAPRVAAHWAFMLEPLLDEHAEGDPKAMRYRQIESYRMPLMAYVAVDEPRALNRADFIRLGLAAAPGEQGLPLAEDSFAGFEQKHCWDLFWHDAGRAPQTRYLVSGKVLAVIGRADAEFFRCRDRGVLAQFRHQHFLIFLIAHFQRAALLACSDRLVEALRRLDIGDPESVKRFKRAIRAGFEGFLRFTHRYWFHTISEQAQARSLYALCTQHLDLDPLYAEVKQRIGDLANYLEADSLRRQANTVVRLTVVTIFSMIGTITTGFLGMNLLAEADAPMERRVWIFMLTLVLTALLTVYTIAKSKRLSDFLDAVSDERLGAWTKLKVFLAVWKP
ncbi:CorA family divalent cation transporter [Pelomonas sp. KK5]|uniref:CorA family divalent cation transporter n=1 Tax=Pelomonas sp. KK5 TaxID=1855730 RepID=UPI00097C56AB|nr:CorA family divalent cation transporter [Pelomonas sp. KK5]